MTNLIKSSCFCKSRAGLKYYPDFTIIVLESSTLVVSLAMKPPTHQWMMWLILLVLRCKEQQNNNIVKFKKIK